MKNSPDIFSLSSDEQRLQRNRQLIWFVAGAILIILVSIAFMMVQKGLFERTAQLHFLADSAKGMTPGMAVKLNGFRVGDLDKLAMDGEGRVTGVLRLGEDYIHLIHKDAKARWNKEDMIGESIIEIVPGSQQAPAVENNGVIGFERAGDLGQTVSELTKQLQPILADVKSITAYIDNPDGDIKQTLQQLQRTSGALAELSKEVDQLIKHNEPRLNSAMNSASNTLTTLDKALPPLLKRVDNSLQNVEAVSADAHQISRQLAPELPAAVSEGRATLEDTHQMIKAVKQSWPMNKLIPPAEEHALPLDSHVPTH